LAAGVTDLAAVAPAFVEVAHRIVWARVATVGGQGRPRSRVLHPYWVWDGSALVGWIATSPTTTKRGHLERSPFVSVGYWWPDHDVATAECRATWAFDDETRRRIWDTFREAPAPVGYDPAEMPPWSGGPTSDAFAALRLDPWHLRVLPVSLAGGPGPALVWDA